MEEEEEEEERARRWSQLVPMAEDCLEKRGSLLTDSLPSSNFGTKGRCVDDLRDSTLPLCLAK